MYIVDSFYGGVGRAEINSLVTKIVHKYVKDTIFGTKHGMEGFCSNIQLLFLVPSTY